MRLDQYLVQKRFFNSRNKAIEFIKNNKVKVNNKIINKPSFKVLDEIKIEILDKVYVSRAALKLKYFLDEIGLDLKEKIALDIGSSTGGFAQILLQNGVKKLYCVDVGSNQLDISIKNNPKVKVFEQTDIRDFEVNFKFDIITCDVSFISVLKIINKIKELANDKVIILFKPQFEVGLKAKRDKNGVVIDKEAIKESKKKFIDNIKKNGFKILYNSVSKISGKNGNIEELFLLQV